MARFAAGALAAALAAFREATAVDPDFARAWNNAGIVVRQLGRPADAVQMFHCAAAAARPDDPQPLVNRAAAREDQGDAAAALADYDRAAELATGEYRALVLHNRGTLRYRVGDLAGAEADFTAALAVVPARPNTLLGRALVRKDAGDLAGAEADCEAALAVLPPEQAAPALHRRGGVKVLRGDFAGAVADCDAAIDLGPENYCYYLSRGNAHYHRRSARGMADYRMAFRLDQTAAAAETLELFARDAAGRPDEVLGNCDKHVRLDDRDALALARRGVTLLLLGRPAEAEADIARFRELVPALWPLYQAVRELASARMASPGPR